jgi:CHAT domain-containing protein/Tfp pilus assembly protein PilF
MHYRLKSLSLATATLLLSLTSPLLPLTLKFEPLVVQAQTLEQQEPGAEKWFLEAYQLWLKGDYPATLEKLQQDLVRFRKEGDRTRVGAVLSCIGIVYRTWGKPTQALEYSQKALALLREVGKLPNGERSTARTWEGRTLFNIGVVYSNLGQDTQALEFLNQALAINREVGDHLWEERTLSILGGMYSDSGQYSKALEFYQQALAICQEIGNRLEEGWTLVGLGMVYHNLGQYPKALEFYQQALAIHKTIGYKEGEGTTINNIGNIYHNLGQYPKALEFYQQALAILKEVGNNPREGMILSNIGLLLESQNHPELAIVFYKQSVNLIEEIRKDLRVLPKEQQQSYTETVAGRYRRLANLLLKQDRVLEAQRVLDLLKVQELDEYLRNVRGNNNTAQGLPNLPPEQQTWASYQAVLDKAIEIGKELTQLRQIKSENRTAQQEQRIAQLVNAQQKIVEDFNNFTESPEVLALIQQLNPKARKADLVNNLDELNALQDNLRNLQQNAVLLYPLILDDRIELILTTPDSPPIRRTVQVTKQQLNETIVAFRSALQNPTSDAKIPAQQLYNWLIKPLEAELKVADAKTIIYAPDAQLRYIPLAALHDGQQWLVQRYRINNITAASLTDLNTKPQRQMQVLAGAFATGRYSFKVGGESFDFAGLPSAGVEVENLAKTVPTTTKLIDTAFTPDVTVPKMDDYTVVHLATHAAFVVGTPDDSFILFGNGERVTLRDIQKWSLKNVDLVVLSACETGLGGKLGNGEEILGLGYQMQRAGARAAIASLWTVDDGGTQALMDSFYAALESKQVGQDSQPTKAEALRQAQIALITGDYKALGQQRGLGVQQRIQRSLSPKVATRLSHPYYWAPFILIGNGL